MAIEEPGVLWRDGVYFYAASNFAKQQGVSRVLCKSIQ